MRYCFLDTNIFLQFQTFDEVDWAKVVDADEVCLVVPLTVIDELDKHKNDPTSDRRRSRAKRIIGKLKQLKGKEFRAKTTLLMLSDNPRSEWFIDNGVDLYDNDAKIIGTAKWFWEQSPDGDVVTISNDYGFQLRAESLNIVCVEPNDYLEPLPDEPDPQQKEITDLKKQLVRLQNAIPKLKLRFRQGDELVDCLNLSIDFDPIELTDEEIELHVRDQRTALSYNRTINDKHDEDGLAFMSFNPSSAEMLGMIRYPSEKEIDRYNSMVNTYLKEYEEFLRKLMQYKAYRATTSDILLVLENFGSAPADDIDMHLYFQEGPILHKKLRQPPAEPRQPSKPSPRSVFDDFALSISPSLTMPSPPNYSSPRDSNGPVIHKSSIYEVSNDLERLKQHYIWDWPRLYATFHKPAKLPTAFNVEYEITAANIPDVVSGKLVIKLIE